ncbi:replication termination factor 2-like [Clytia hemisphaerica]|uniref:Replication termination factor 2 n=1 Tax=Clytia hemisphaerica TaxID=252671 RepID=A0A7M5VES5_9CNID
MGCDGGTIPKRHELVKTAKRPEQKDKDMDRKAKWSTCTISQQPLSSPVVACELGKLYSKESIIEFLLDRSICETANHIRNLKDVKTLKLTPNAGFDSKASGTANEYYDTQSARFVCPVVGIEMNGKYKFYTLWSCGCVLSERAFKEVESETCHNCGEKFDKDDVIVLNAEGEDLEKMETNMKERREKMKKAKKLKKEKSNEKRKAENGVHEFAVPQKLSNAKTDDKQRPAKKPKLSSEVTDTKSKINGSGKDVPAKKAKSSKSKEDKVDIKQSKVYKNLFTSSEKKNGKDNQAHWVTYNPYHL